MTMKIYQRMARDYSFVQPDAGYGSDATRAKIESDCRAEFVHSSNRVDGAAEPTLDLAAIEERARDARAAWIGSKLKHYYEVLVRKFANGGQAEMENYLAASQNLADLEERIRRYERVQSRCY